MQRFGMEVKMKKKDKNFMSTVKVGQKGQIVIPKEIREMFDIDYGDSLIIMADRDRGIAIQKANVLSQIADAIFAGKGKEIYPREDQDGLQGFAETIKKNVKGEEKEK